MREGLTPVEAATAVLDGIEPLDIESAPLRDAVHRVLAERIRSPTDIPPWDNSAMDGYAVRSADLGAARPSELRVIETIPAGRFPARTLGPGECARIFTGAPLPAGCDGVIRQEDTTLLAGDRVRIDDCRDAGRNVRFRGEDIRRGSTVFEPGVELGPAHVGVLASLAMPLVKVHRRPRVALLGSGDELADLDEADAIRAGRKIASSNSYTIAAALRDNGADVTDLGIARDDPADLRTRLEHSAGADLIVTTAGVSVGEHDHVRSVLDEIGLEPRFWRIRMRPGAPVGYGLLRGAPWVGLPGNPVSAMVAFELFVRPLLRRLSGFRAVFRRAVSARVTEPIRLGPRLCHFLRAVVSGDDGARTARLTGPQGSGILMSMALANALLIVPEDKPQVEAGETLRTLLLDEPTHVEDPPY